MITRTGRPAVLFLDDEANILKALARLFRSEPVSVHTAGSAEEALELLDREPIQVVLTDQNMPGVRGVEFLEQVRKRWPDVIRMMLTGYTEMNVAVQAINQVEIYRLITKPWNDEELRATVSQALDTYYMRKEIRRLDELTREQNRALQEMNHTLELKVQQRTREVEQKHAELREGYVSTVRALVAAVDAKDSYTRGHSERVGVYASRIACELGCKAEFIERIYLAGLLHDIGKIGIPDAIITKPSTLTEEEYEEIKKHPEIGARILAPVSFLADVAPCVRHHHEWYDGSKRGYPDRLRGDRIPYASRIILVADTIEAMTSDRPYRRALPVSRVIDELYRFAGSQFDPRIVEAALSLLEVERDGFLARACGFQIEGFLAEMLES
ncbi:MAG: HD domain-containing phosphohydrolase [Myxococcota bacterium]